MPSSDCVDVTRNTERFDILSEERAWSIVNRAAEKRTNCIVGKRDGLVNDAFHPKKHYRFKLTTFSSQNLCRLTIAARDEKPVPVLLQSQDMTLQFFRRYRAQVQVEKLVELLHPSFASCTTKTL